MLSFFVLAIGAISPDGMGVDYQPRLPANEQILTPQAVSKNIVPEQASNNKKYNYVLFQKGPVKVTRRSLDLAVRLSTIIFTVIYSTNLYLLTTAPEEITSGIESLMQPLRRFKLPVTEIALTLTLSLRFIPLVLEEVQNLFRSVMTRAINWKKLGLKGGFKVWMTVAERLLENLLLRADQMANAMMVRGFTSPNEHRVQWHDLRFKGRDWLAIATLIVFWGIRLAIGTQV
jgi:energy-coupling factor transport system permease protein